MTSNICYAVVYFIESLISLYYFDFKFKRKIAKKFIFLFALGNFIILYILHFCEIPIINLLGFFFCNFLISILCYNTKLANPSIIVYKKELRRESLNDRPEQNQKFLYHCPYRPR